MTKDEFLAEVTSVFGADNDAQGDTYAVALQQRNNVVKHSGRLIDGSSVAAHYTEGTALWWFGVPAFALCGQLTLASAIYVYAQWLEEQSKEHAQKAGAMLRESVRYERLALEHMS